MGHWGYYSFTNDLVFDIMGASIQDRIPGLAVTEVIPAPNLTQLLQYGYTFRFSSELPKDEHIYRMEMEALDNGSSIAFVGLVILFCANQYTPSQEIIELAVENLNYELQFKENALREHPDQFSKWYIENESERIAHIHEEIEYLQQFLE